VKKGINGGKISILGIKKKLWDVDKILNLSNIEIPITF